MDRCDEHVLADGFPCQGGQLYTMGTYPKRQVLDLLQARIGTQ
jgi:hypothetical protein